jgi:hypothetical protein
MARIYDIREDGFREATQTDVDMLSDFVQTFGFLVMTSKNREIKKAVAAWKARNHKVKNSHA